MFRWNYPKFDVTIARGALESIFDECDQFEAEETGGRLIGPYSNHGNRYHIQVLGVLGPGPNARRSRTSFFQDGEYQEQLFRTIEQKHPSIEHLGNWHTHHVNGLATLSGGDKATYQATVNHQNHNTDLFYALLVTRKTGDREQRYDIKHYFFRRNDNEIYELSGNKAEIVDIPAVWTRKSEHALSLTCIVGHNEIQGHANLERPKDEELFSAFYPGLRSLFSDKLGALYWKGPMDLIDGSHLRVVAIETVTEGKICYFLNATSSNSTVAEVLDRYRDRTFGSARHAILTLEKDINRTLFRSLLRSTST